MAVLAEADCEQVWKVKVWPWGPWQLQQLFVECEQVGGMVCIHLSWEFNRVFHPWGNLRLVLLKGALLVYAIFSCDGDLRC